MENINYTFNEDGIPCCLHDPSLPMKREGSKSNLRSRIPTMKFVCPEMKWEHSRETKKSRRVCHCGNPCTSSPCGRMVYVYPEKNSVLTLVLSVVLLNGMKLILYRLDIKKYLKFLQLLLFSLLKQPQYLLM